MAVPTAIARAGKSQSICETELQREFPLHVVCSWLGSSPRIAQQSYLLETEDDFDGAEGEKKVMLGGAGRFVLWRWCPATGILTRFIPNIGQHT
jgi:hypothetical protein